MVFVSKSGDVAEYRSGTGHRPDSENNGMNSLKRSITDSESSANRKSKVQYIHMYMCMYMYVSQRSWVRIPLRAVQPFF